MQVFEQVVPLVKIVLYLALHASALAAAIRAHSVATLVIIIMSMRVTQAKCGGLFVVSLVSRLCYTAASTAATR